MVGRRLLSKELIIIEVQGYGQFEIVSSCTESEVIVDLKLSVSSSINISYSWTGHEIIYDGVVFDTGSNSAKSHYSYVWTDFLWISVGTFIILSSY